MALTDRPRPGIHDHKRYGGHHRHSKGYMKSYWPYLPMLLIVGLGLLVNTAWSGKAVLGSASDFSNNSLLKDTNAQRDKADEPALTLNAQLISAAQAKADDMVRANYWSHDSPDGKTPWWFIASSGYQYYKAGENLAYGFPDAESSIEGWMNSPEHRANILNAAYSDVGFGVASSPDYVGHGPATVVVAEYGQPVAGGYTGIASNPTNVNTGPNVLEANSSAKPVSRIQIIAGNQSELALLGVIVISGAAMALFLLRHGYRAHRLISMGESFVTQHPYLDIAIVFTITAGCVLTRVSGVVR